MLAALRLMSQQYVNMLSVQHVYHVHHLSLVCWHTIIYC